MRLSYEGDQSQAQEWLGKSQQELDRLRTRMEIGGREQGSFAHALSDTAYVYGGILPGGYEWMHIITSPGVEGTTSVAPLFKPTTPDFISGVVTDPRIVTFSGSETKERLQGFVPTQPTALLHKSETLTQPSRLAVDPSPTFEDMKPTHSPFHWSQYSFVRPTMYSGKMRKVIQALLGFGKRTTSIYDLAKPHLDAEKGTTEKPIATKWESETLTQGLRVWYDFRWARTHGITKAADGKLWLVEISLGRGIVAMPLPVWPISAQSDFYDKVIGMGDLEAQTMIDELGGFPTGEHFPINTNEFNAYVKAGRIIRLAEASDLALFYASSMYGSGVGWAFNEDGSEAHNTGYNYAGGQGYQLGVHFACDLAIGATLDTDPGTRIQKASRATKRRALRQKFGSFRTSSDFKDTFEAAMWKIDHASDAKLFLMEAMHGSLKEQMNELVAMDIDALATGTASVGQMGEGFIWNGARPAAQPQIKFPEPILGQILSHDLRASDEFGLAARNTPVQCDTTMFVFFKNNELVTVRYYYKPTPGADTKHTDDYEECMYGGSWSSHDESGGRSIPAGFYTTEFDDRHEVSGSTVDETIKGADMGWVNVSNGDDPVFPAHGWTQRSRGYLMTQNRVTIQGAGWQTAIAIPLWDREAYYYAYLESFDSRVTLFQQSVKMLGDPNYAEYWRYFPGWTHKTDQHPAGCGLLSANRTVKELLKGDVSPCQELIDEGPWLSVCQNVEHTPYNIAIPTLPAVVTTEPHTKHVRVYFSSSSEEVPELVLQEKTRSDPDTPYWTGGLWFVVAPDDSGNTQAIYTTRNSLGDGSLIWIQEEINGGKYTVRGGPQLVPVTAPPPNFVGVING
jgi:hypothetical protein